MMSKKLLFGITSLTLGGAERVLVDLANALCKKYDVTIFTIYAKGELEKQLDKEIHLKSFAPNSYAELSSFQKKIGMPLKLLLSKKKIYQKEIANQYDVEIAFLEGPITRLFAVRNSKSRKIAWIHNDLSVVFGKGIKAKLKKRLDQKIYTKYEKLIFVSQDNRKEFEDLYHAKRMTAIPKEVIYNYIDKERILRKSEEKPEIIFSEDTIHFLTVARLVPQKGIDRLIRIHSKLIQEGKKHHFYVIGTGPEKENLELLIKRNGVENSFHLLGQKENPYPYMKQADYFCLLSNFEGYGMVLEEAKLLNKPILITDTAAREAVKDYSNSQVLENTEQGIYEGLKVVCEKENTRDKSKQANNPKEENEEKLQQVIKLIESKE